MRIETEWTPITPDETMIQAVKTASSMTMKITTDGSILSVKTISEILTNMRTIFRTIDKSMREQDGKPCGTKDIMEWGLAGITMSKSKDTLGIVYAFTLMPVDGIVAVEAAELPLSD